MVKKVSKIFALAMVFIQILILMPNTFAAIGDSASVTLGQPDRAVNLTLSDPMTVVERLGRMGRKSDIASNCIYFYVNVNDALMYDLPNSTPVEVTVEYYDEGEGSFELDYDSYNPWSANGVWGNAESVQLENTKTWKSYTYYLEDMKMANRCMGWDFRIGVWGNGMGWSKADVIFGRIEVKRVDYKSLVTQERLKSANYGNIFSMDDELKLNVACTNKTDREIVADVESEVYDENGTQVWSGKFGDELAANENKALEFEPKFDKKYGIYNVKNRITTYYKDNPDKKYVSEGEYQISIAYKVADEDANPIYGANQQVIALHRGDAKETATQMRQAGMSYVRDYVPWSWVEKEKGKYKIPDENWEQIKAYKEGGIKPLMMLGFTNRYYDNDKTPCSDEAIQGYANYAAFIAKELKDYTNIFEIWNEWNGGEGFNPSQSPPEDYARLIKVAYRAIKAANPDAIVLGLTTAGHDIEWAERAFAAGALDYMDGLALHPYLWIPGTFNWQKLIDYSETMKEMMRKYGGEKPIWFTEVGFSSSSGRYSVEEQAYNSVMLYALMNSNKLADGLTQYAFYNRWDKDEVEHNWGFLNWNDDPENPSTAKPAYLAACAMNNFVGKGVAEYKEFIRTDTKYRAFKFYNNKMNKDVILINSDDTEAYLSYDLGCDAVDVYDAYGNMIDTLSSSDGIYTFNMTQEPKYVTGNFNKFSLAEGYAPKIQSGITEIEAASDDVISFEYKNNTGIDDKNLHIKAELPECMSVNENNGFSDNSAELKLYTAPKSTGKLVYKISIVDDNGTVYYSEKYKIKIVDPIKLDFAAEKAVETSDNHWRVRVNIINTSNTNTVGGTLTVTKPSEEAEFIAPRTFSNLKARETTTLLLNLPPRVTKQTFDLEFKVKLNNGNEYTYSGRLDFGSSAYAENKPTIDGVVSVDEWRGSWVGADNIKDVREIIDWRGPEDLSFSGISMWDEDYFYLLSIVTDDIYSLDYSPKEPHYMYRGDNIQFGLSDKVDIDSARVRDFTEFGVAEVPNYGSLVYRYKSLYNLPTAQIVSNAEAAVKRYDAYTVFECKIPWSEVFQEGFVPKSGQVLRFSLMANDNDGNSRRGWIEYTSGIGYEKLVTDFGSLVLSK